jgi:hypothetical protein
MLSNSYPSLEAFYAADRRRRHSRERDVGLLWRDNGHAAFRAAWVQETGELYLFTLGEVRRLRCVVGLCRAFVCGGGG